MRLAEHKIGGVYLVKDVSRNNPCNDCSSCVRLRIMEMGMMPGTKIELNKHHLGLWVLNILSDNGTIESTVALREEEAERIVLEDGCLVGLESVT